MGERVWFATSNWKDKPNKPSCYTQAQWDARNSSKFNGVPFAGGFAVTDAQVSSLKVKGYKQSDIDAYKAAIEAISVADCEDAEWCPTKKIQPAAGTRMNLLNAAVGAVPLPQEIDVDLTCQDIDMTVWDGSTYFEDKRFEKTWEWTSCCSGKPRSYTAGFGSNIKKPSKRSDVYVPVCGPGTHIQEITKDELMKIVWQVSQFDLNASGFKAEVKTTTTYSGSCVSGDSGSSSTVTTSNKNLDPSISSPGKESNIVSLNWDACKQMGYTGQDSMGAASQNDGSFYTDGPYGTGNGNITVSANATVSYKCGHFSTYVTGSGRIDITINPFSDRNKYIYFVTDPTSDAEKIYFDPTGLFTFTMVSNGYTYNLNPTESGSPHSLTLNLFGKNYTLKVGGIANGTYNSLLNNPPRSTSTQTSFTGGTITITGKKYYPYANSNGEAIYDEDTGAQLKDPLS
jgi:hypothetical protein